MSSKNQSHSTERKYYVEYPVILSRNIFLRLFRAAAVAVAGQSLWNALPCAIRNSMSLVMSWLDYYYAVLYGLPDAQLQKLQLVQNAAARLVTETHRREHITPVLFALHWLPIRQRIQFKLLLLVYRCIHQLAPAYLMDLVVPYVPARSLRSAEQNFLTVKRYNLERFGRRSFSVAGPSLWNALPSAIRNSMSLSAFRSSLKTHLFLEAFVTLLLKSCSHSFTINSFVSLLFNFYC